MKRQTAMAVMVAVLGLGLAAGPASAGEDLPQLVRKIQPSVVTVIAYDAGAQVKAQGSGFFISKNGAFITNYHVLAGAPRARVETADGRQYPVVGIVDEDKGGDLVVGAVKPPPEGFPSLKISAALPEAGERVVVVGSPLGLEQTISDGVVSGTRQLSGVGEILQISAPISPGSSGSPVVNLNGEVVGVATLQLAKGQNLNFAMPGYRILALARRATQSAVLKISPLKEQPPAPAEARKQPSSPAPFYADKGAIRISVLTVGDDPLCEIFGTALEDVISKSPRYILIRQKPVPPNAYPLLAITLESKTPVNLVGKKCYFEYLIITIDPPNTPTYLTKGTGNFPKESANYDRCQTITNKFLQEIDSVLSSYLH